MTLERFVPVTVTSVPTGPAAGANVDAVGGRMTVRAAGLAPVPAAVVTEIAPVTAVAGTLAVMCESSSTVKVVAATAPNLTAVAPVKVVPVIWTLSPRTAIVGSKRGDLRRHLEDSDAQDRPSRVDELDLRGVRALPGS